MTAIAEGWRFGLLALAEPAFAALGRGPLHRREYAFLLVRAVAERLVLR